MVVTWDAVNKGSAIVLSNNNLTATVPGNLYTVRATEGKTSGKWYWEIKFETLSNSMLGIVRESTNLNAVNYNVSGTAYYYVSGNKYPGATTYGSAYTVSDIISVLLDMDLGTIEFWKNGISQGVMFNDLKTNPSPVYPAITSGSGSAGSTSTVRFNINDFTYQPPEGYLAYDGTKSISNKILLSSNEKTYTIQKGEVKSENAIPNMTNNTTPSGFAFTSTGATSDYAVFDGVNTTGRQTTTASGGGMFIYGYRFDKEIVIGAYSLLLSANLTLAPKDWNFEGSNDGINYINLGTVGNQTTWVANQAKYFEVDNTKSYRYYRINITGLNGASTYLYEFQMFERLPSKIVELPDYSESNFIRYGMNSPVKVDEIYSNKNYILQDTTSENAEGLWTTQINRKPLSIKFN